MNLLIIPNFLLKSMKMVVGVKFNENLVNFITKPFK